MVDRIAEARVDVNLDNRTESIGDTFTYTLCDKDGKAVDAELITTNVEKIMMVLRIARIKELKLVVEIVPGGGATEDSVECEISTETIRVSGSNTQLSSMEQIKVGTIDLAEVPTDEIFIFMIKLPEGVENETGITEVTATVRFKDLATKTVKVSNFELINQPKGMDIQLITEELEVQMRGPAAQLEQLNSANVTAEIDFKDATAGTVTFRAKITSSISGVGAVGSYTISATIQKKE